MGVLEERPPAVWRFAISQVRMVADQRSLTRRPDVLVFQNARASDFKKATERVYHDKSDPSGVVVGVLAR